MKANLIERISTEIGAYSLQGLTAVGILMVFGTAFDLNILPGQDIKLAAGVLLGIIFITACSSVLLSIMLNIKKIASIIENNTLFKNEGNEMNNNLTHIILKVKSISTLLIILFFASCDGQDKKLLQVKSSILNNQSEKLIELAKVANVIDSDYVSYWAYGYADSILTTFDIPGKNYYEDLSKVYSATTHIFFGMSYTRSILAISRGDKYSLEELSKTIVEPLSIVEFDFKRLSISELSSIYSIINFYKVSRMPRYDDMYILFQNDSLEMETTYKNYTAETAYRIVSLENKKLHFKTFAGLIIDIYSINHQNSDKSGFNNYVQGLVKLGEEVDEIPSSYDIIAKLTEQEYYDYVLKSSEIQKKMLNLLVTEIMILKQRNE
jgi:hypothetical protein